MLVFTLDAREVSEVETLVDMLAAKRQFTSDSKFFQDITFYAQELPRRLREFMVDIKYGERAGACVVSGFPVDDRAIGRTPPHWSREKQQVPTVREEIGLALFGSLLGDLFGWATQQDGAVIHNIVPIAGHEHEQLGSGSTDLLLWHTEEAFHPLRCDYLGLMCLRNYDKIPTTFASIDMIDLEEDVRQILFQPRFLILPDKSHFVAYSDANGKEINKNQQLGKAYESINRMNETPDKMPLLYGDPASPYMAVDLVYMQAPEDDKEAQYALNRLIAVIDAKITDIVLEPGECCFIDNFRAVHGRKPFLARYDGTDRWLKRINITRDIRKSRSSRGDLASRVVY